MRQRGQATVLLIALAVPLGGLALLGLTLLGARVQGERAQRLADAAALRAAMGRTALAAPEATVVVTQAGADRRATVTLATARLQLPLIGRVGFTAQASAVARAVVTEDGRAGAALVG